MKVREAGLLKGSLYSDNKVKIKKVFKAHGLKFNQGACMSAKCFLWQSEEGQVEGKFTKDKSGTTIRAELVITAEDRTPAFDDLKECVLELGGSWSIVSEEEMEVEAEEEADEEFAAFEKKWKHKLLFEERNGRKSGFNHCPILKPFIKQYLEERESEYGLTDKTVDKVLKEIYKIVDKEMGE